MWVRAAFQVVCSPRVYPEITVNRGTNILWQGQHAAPGVDRKGAVHRGCAVASRRLLLLRRRC